jgi:hypothetical protein
LRFLQVEVQGRLKSLRSVHNKMQRKACSVEVRLAVCCFDASLLRMGAGQRECSVHNKMQHKACSVEVRDRLNAVLDAFHSKRLGVGGWACSVQRAQQDAAQGLQRGGA